jgi:hypothetical protein
MMKLTLFYQASCLAGSAICHFRSGFCHFPAFNPNGIASSSPGLRAASYPGKQAERLSNPEGFAAAPHRVTAAKAVSRRLATALHEALVKVWRFFAFHSITFGS